jgi:hypothetical protein
MTEVAQAYFHSRPFEIVRVELRRFGKIAEEVAQREAQLVYPENAELIIDIRPVSLKGWITVVDPVVFTIYAGISDYKSFKENRVEIVIRAQTFAGEFNETFMKACAIDPSTVFRTERRSKAPGKGLRALRELEALDEFKQGASSEEIEQHIVHAEHLLADAARDLAEEDRAVLAEFIPKPSRPGGLDEILPRSVLIPRGMRSDEAPDGSRELWGLPTSVQQYVGVSTPEDDDQRYLRRVRIGKGPESPSRLR